MDGYQTRGVSATKDDVHKAIEKHPKGLFPNAFCQIYPDIWGGDPDYCNLMHADGVGTKTVIAYMYWRETGDLSVWRNLVIDAIVMNLDDLLCAGATNNFTYSSSIARNLNLIPGQIIAELIDGTHDYFKHLANYGINVTLMGGETADMGDTVRTLMVEGTMGVRMPLKRLITCQNIAPGNVVVGLASSGKASYETEYNSGIGSNGLTAARQHLLHPDYYHAYKECYDPYIPQHLVYTGSHHLQDATDTPLNVGKLMLSPTRTYLPLLKPIIEQYHDSLYGIIHCSGGGQRKCINYLPGNMRVVKNNLLPRPPLFNMIAGTQSISPQEMYMVYNMGHRMELYTTEATAHKIIDSAKQLNIDAQIIGYVEECDHKEVVVHTPEGIWRYA